VGSLSSRLWQGVLPLASRSLHQPFVLRLAAGTLERSAFSSYVAQDAFFLRAFARAYAHALSRCTSDATMSELSTLLGGVVDELKLHHTIAARWGVDIDHVEPNGATSVYTTFLLDIARSDAPIAVILAAMTPCMRLYAYIGQRLAAAFPPEPSHPYAEWIRTYSSAEFGALADQMDRLLDRCAAGVAIEPMRAAYERAMQLEADFFAAQPGVPPVRGLLASERQLLFAVDFDETITTAQTLPLIAELAERHAGGVAEQAARRAEWQALTDSYLVGHTTAVADALRLPPTRAPAGADGAVCKASLAHVLETISAFEARSVAEAHASRTLRDVPEPALRAAGALRVVLRPGFARLVRALQAADACAHVEVISVNWSSQLVGAALDGALKRPSGVPPLTHVHCNLLPVAAAPDGAEPRTTGELLSGGASGIHSAADKAERFAALAAAGAAASAGRGALMTLYAGDSITDLGPLLAADLGVVFGASGTLRDALDALGVRVLPLVAARRRLAERGRPDDEGASWPAGGALSAAARADGPVVYAADCWHELHACLLGDIDAYAMEPEIHRQASAGAAAATPHEERSALVCALPPSASRGLGPQAGLAAARGAADGGSEAHEAAAARAPPPAAAATLREAAAARASQSAVPVVLSIAGSDSGGGAGIQADLKTCAALGAFGTTALAGLTAQNTRGVHAIEPVSEAFLKAQLDAVLSDFNVGAVKTGMLPTAGVIGVVCAALDAYRVRHVVVDPVMIAASGDSLVGADALRALLELLVPRATLLTPNLPEAELMLGLAAGSIATVDDMRDAALRLHALGCGAVLVKGGHLSDDDACATDVLYDGRSTRLLRALRVQTSNSHGTGCTLSSAIATHLARGASLHDAVLHGKTYLTSALAASASARLGGGAHGPLNHAYASFDWAACAEPGVAEGAAERRRACVRAALALYAVTDPALSEPRGGVVAAGLAALQGGVSCLQLRDKGTGARMLEHARQLLPAARAKGVPLIINDRIDVMCAARRHARRGRASRVARAALACAFWRTAPARAGRVRN
jgi:hydroxymethylpyrimidine kinase/phosphomethylpyrimidine kinase/thiamine-phosphate diphosphorylase